MLSKIIYQKGGSSFGHVLVTGKKTALKKSSSPKHNPQQRKLGRLLTVVGLLTTFLFISPMILGEINWQFLQLKNKAIEKVDQESKFAEVIRISNLKILQPVNPEFSLIIPKIGVNQQVLAQVPAGDKKVYNEALKKGVAHAQGSHLPGENGSIYLFGHSSNFIWDRIQNEPVFHLLNKLETGDQINIFYQNERLVYRVSEKKIVKADEVEYLKPTRGQEKIILGTCWPLGTNIKRLIVLADKT